MFIHKIHRNILNYGVSTYIALHSETGKQVQFGDNLQKQFFYKTTSILISNIN